MKKRKLLLDSCVAKAVADRLRADGHDVLVVAEHGADPGDPAILALAVSEGRVLITIDHDFGALVFRDNANHAGVLRLRPMAAQVLAARASDLSPHSGMTLKRGLSSRTMAMASASPSADETDMGACHGGGRA